MGEAYNLADSLKNSGMSRQMTEFTIKYKTQEKELMIAQLDAERANQQSLIAILLLILALLAVIVFFVLYRRRITRKENELALQRRFIEGLESERARLARELHDGVCNDLLGVQLALNSGKDNASQMVRHIMTDIRQISHELMPPRFNMANVAQILSDYIGHLPYCTGTYWQHRTSCKTVIHPCQYGAQRRAYLSIGGERWCCQQ